MRGVLKVVAGVVLVLIGLLHFFDSEKIAWGMTIALLLFLVAGTRLKNDDDI